jgi:Na+-transporting NADH:ubiquinone oxidoreductase subunit B
VIEKREPHARTEYGTGYWSAAPGLRCLPLDCVTLLAVLPVLGVALFERGARWLVVLTASVLVIVAWQALFAVVRRRPWPTDGIVAALLIALMLPSSMPLWQVALAASFGIVAGQEIFGGRGLGFLNPAVVALAFLIFSFPEVELQRLSPATVVAAAPGAALLTAAGLCSWRMLVAAVAGVLIAAMATGMPAPFDAVLAAGFVLGLVFLAADPAAAPSTNPGRWMYGLIFGVLTVIFATKAPGVNTEHVVMAALLSSVFAPLIDVVAIRFNVERRSRRHG